MHIIWFNDGPRAIKRLWSSRFMMEMYCLASGVKLVIFIGVSIPVADASFATLLRVNGECR